MARIASLSVEIHRIILKEVISVSSQRDYKVFTQEVESLIEARRRHATPDSLLLPPAKSLTSIFPYNIAYTCKLWRAVMAETPKYWKHISFDLALDPSPLLGVFAWADKEAMLDVVVFTSATQPTEVVKAEERRRVAAISLALEPYIHRCKSIVFNVMFASSLPSWKLFFSKDAPELEALTVECLVDDKDAETNTSDPDQGHQITPSFVSTPPFGALATLTLAGSLFMDLCPFLELLDGCDWFGPLEFTLHISRFNFHHEFKTNARYTIANFTSGLSQISASDIHLSHLSLSYPWGDWFPTPALLRLGGNIDQYDLHFDLVSKGFISTFFRYISCDMLGNISYSRCALPRMLQINTAEGLTLDSIIEDPQESEDGAVESSLHRALAVWEGTELVVRSCPSFDDHLLEWLGSELEYRVGTIRMAFRPDCHLNLNSIIYLKSDTITTLPAEKITSLRIEDCVNYSVSHLIRLLDIRKEGMRYPDRNAIVDLELVGKKPPLDTDVDWIGRKYY